MQQTNYLSMKGINKSFSGVSALHDVHLDVRGGEVHALMGENGAGKSTLMKILAGLYHADSGEIYINGEQVQITGPLEARKYGINFIHQEICLAENMTITENLYLGMEKQNGPFLSKKEMTEFTQKHLDMMGLNLRADMQVQGLSIAQQQMVEIARALFFDAKLVVMDEPTSSLTNKEVDSLFEQIEKLRQNNVSIIYISHRMEEIFKIADRVTVLRDGGYVGTRDMKDLTLDELISMMVGREIQNGGMKEKVRGGKDILEVKHLTNQRLHDISFSLRKGEVLGFAGLVGAGRTEMAQALYGIDKYEGEVILNGKPIHNRCVPDALDNHIVLVPEDRKKYGLITSLDVKFNLTLAVLKQFITGCHVNKKRESEIIDEYSRKLSIKMSGPSQICAGLSGGNQQKVVISKWLALNPEVIIMDEPTRGIDVGAKDEIYDLILRLAKEGISVILISSELPEILKLSSRIAVMYEGRLQTIIDTENRDVTQEEIMYYATGGSDNE